jgi:hypothetical protein
MSPKSTLVLTGATGTFTEYLVSLFISLTMFYSGYIGGAVLSRLLAHPSISSYKLKTMVRAQDKAEKLKNFGVESVIGSYADLDKLEQLGAEADVFIEIVTIIRTM